MELQQALQACTGLHRPFLQLWPKTKVFGQQSSLRKRQCILFNFPVKLPTRFIAKWFFPLQPHTWSFLLNQANHLGIHPSGSNSHSYDTFLLGLGQSESVTQTSSTLWSKHSFLYTCLPVSLLAKGPSRKKHFVPQVFNTVPHAMTAGWWGRENEWASVLLRYIDVMSSTLKSQRV